MLGSVAKQNLFWNRTGTWIIFYQKLWHLFIETSFINPRYVQKNDDKPIISSLFLSPFLNAAVIFTFLRFCGNANVAMASLKFWWRKSAKISEFILIIFEGTSVSWPHISWRQCPGHTFHVAFLRRILFIKWNCHSDLNLLLLL